MLRRNCAILLSLGALAAAPHARADGASTARKLLRQANDFYVKGAYQRAVDMLRSIVEAKILENRADQLEALRVYGICLYLTGSKPAAARAFTDLLRRDKSVRLDPSFVRPEVVRFFERVRRRWQRERAEYLRKHAPKGSAAVNLLPPWGQFRNGHRVKGWLLLGVEVALLGATIASYGTLRASRRDDGSFPFSDAAYNGLLATNYASAIALGAVLLYGAIDGLYYYYRGPKLPDDKPRAASLTVTPVGIVGRF